MITVRKALLSDSDRLFLLAKEFTTSFIVEPEPFNLALNEILSTPEALLLVACDDNLVIGYLLAFDHYTFFANGRVAWVEEIMVEAEYRRAKVGQSLMTHSETWAQSRGARLIALATRRASTFYKALKYEDSATYFRKLL